MRQTNAANTGKADNTNILRTPSAKTKQTNKENIKTSIVMILIIAVIGVLSGCGSKSMVVLMPDPDGNVGQVVVSTEGGQQLLKEAKQSVQARGSKAPPGKVKVLSEAEINSTFAEALAAQPMPPVQFILYFLRDSNELTLESQLAVPKILQTIKKRNSTDIVISGHTDTVGSMEYNYKLSLERAQVMYNILLASGADAANIKVTSHGEGNQLIKTDDDVDEPRNRRVEVVIK